jgi:hypothetical protein
MSKGREVLILPVDEDDKCVATSHATWMGDWSGMGIFCKSDQSRDREQVWDC